MKGISHVEIVISFSIFLIFAFFLLFYLNPARYQDIKPVLLDMLRESIKENSNIDIMEFSLVLQNVLRESECFETEKIFGEAEEEAEEKDIRIFDSNKNIIDFSVKNGKLTIKKSGNEKLYYIYYAKEAFSPITIELTGCEKLKKENYILGAPRIKKIIAEKNLEELANFYKIDYEKTKEALNFPRGFDFLVNITSIKKEIIFEMSRKKPEKVEVVASDVFADMLKKNGETEKIILHIEVW